MFSGSVFALLLHQWCSTCALNWVDDCAWRATLSKTKKKLKLNVGTGLCSFWPYLLREAKNELRACHPASAVTLVPASSSASATASALASATALVACFASNSASSWQGKLPSCPASLLFRVLRGGLVDAHAGWALQARWLSCFSHSSPEHPPVFCILSPPRLGSSLRNLALDFFRRTCKKTQDVP